jgi:hypothetical protein
MPTVNASANIYCYVDILKWVVCVSLRRRGVLVINLNQKFNFFTMSAMAHRRHISIYRAAPIFQFLYLSFTNFDTVVDISMLSSSCVRVFGKNRLCIQSHEKWHLISCLGQHCYSLLHSWRNCLKGRVRDAQNAQDYSQALQVSLWLHLDGVVGC